MDVLEDKKLVLLPMATCDLSEEAALLTSKLLLFVPLNAELWDTLDKFCEKREQNSNQWCRFTAKPGFPHSPDFNMAF